MNNLIGIRGSGKSSILESIRYLLDIPISRNSKDFDYKNAIVQELLGSGGKMTAELIDNRGLSYTIEKIFGETTNIYYEGVLQQNLKIESLINNPLYFGQKDLSELGSEASTDDLITRLIGSKVNDIQIEIVQKSQEIEDLLRDIFKTDISLNRESDLRARKADLEIKEKAYKQNNIDKKLSRQIEFQKDESKLASLLSFEEKIIGILKELWADNTFSTDDFLKYTSKENATIFVNTFSSFTNFSDSFNKIFDIITELDEEKEKLRFIQNQFAAEFEKHKQEFSDIKRTINIQNLNPDTFIQISKQLGQIDDELEEISKLTTKRLELRTKLKKSLTDLKALWYKEYNIIKIEIDKINAYQTSVRIEVEFKGNREKLKDFLKEAIKGSGVSDKNINSIVAEYQDLIEVYNDLRIDESKIKKILSTSDFFPKFREKFRERASSFLTFRVPDKYNIYYKDRLLKEHSLGQRASAVILFILSLKENDLILIDQPEDDLDNQTIYEDVISELKRLKNKTQFIFATHNPNIPVLGDCEQIFACNFVSDESKSEIKTSIGSIDNLFIQGRIVSIMEGGKEAFNHRKMIYDNWKNRT